MNQLAYCGRRAVKWRFAITMREGGGKKRREEGREASDLAGCLLQNELETREQREKKEGARHLKWKRGTRGESPPSSLVPYTKLDDDPI